MLSVKVDVAITIMIKIYDCLLIYIPKELLGHFADIFYQVKVVVEAKKSKNIYLDVYHLNK